MLFGFGKSWISGSELRFERTSTITIKWSSNTEATTNTFNETLPIVFKQEGHIRTKCYLQGLFNTRWNSNLVWLHTAQRENDYCAPALGRERYEVQLWKPWELDNSSVHTAQMISQYETISMAQCYTQEHIISRLKSKP